MAGRVGGENKYLLIEKEKCGDLPHVVCRGSQAVSQSHTSRSPIPLPHSLLLFAAIVSVLRGWETTAKCEWLILASFVHSVIDRVSFHSSSAFTKNKP